MRPGLEECPPEASGPHLLLPCAFPPAGPVTSGGSEHHPDAAVGTRLHASLGGLLAAYPGSLSTTGDRLFPVPRL